MTRPKAKQAARRLLAAHHVEIDRTLDRLRLTAESGDPHALVAAWGEFAPMILRHMDAEEELVLPAVEPSHAAEVALIRADHTVLRALVAELGIGVQLHVVRADAIQALVTRLAAHARREDQFLYPWAEEVLSRTTWDRIEARLRPHTATKRDEASTRTAGGGA